MIFFPKLSLSIFLILSWLRIIITIKLNHMRKALWFFLQNTVDCYNIFLNSFLFLFYWGKHYKFPAKHYQLLQRFFSLVFFIPKLSLLVFFFNIKLVENLTLYFFLLFINKKAKLCGEILYLSSQNTVDCYKLFCSVSKFFYHQ